MTEPRWVDPQIGELLVGETPVMRELRRLIRCVAGSAAPVWIEGETGAGKEHVARAIHLASGRSGSLVPVNVCAIADTMFESAMFGHERGAFTGAFESSDGHLAEADRGTLFLDEIGSLRLDAQAKLLRAIETGTYRRIGARTDRRSDFRSVAATNVPFEQLVSAGLLREDLGFRLRGFPIRVPPLRARLDDLPQLTAHLLGRDHGTGPRTITAEALALLMRHPWPGNVRELAQVLHTARTLSDGERLGAADVERVWVMREIPLAAPSIDDERAMLRELLVRHGWDTARAATERGVDRSTIYRWMRRFGVAVPRASPATGFAQGALGPVPVLAEVPVTGPMHAGER